MWFFVTGIGFAKEKVLNSILHCISEIFISPGNSSDRAPYGANNNYNNIIICSQLIQALDQQSHYQLSACVSVSVYTRANTLNYG